MGRAPSKAVPFAVALLAFAACSSGGGSPSSLPPVPAPIASSVTPSSGPIGGGTAVVLHGTNFSSAAVVLVGGTAAAITSVAPSAIAFVTPPHPAGAVDVTVRNPDQQSATLPAAFTYVPPPALSSVSPTSGSSAGGTAVTLGGTAFSSGATVTFGGNPATVGAVTATSVDVTTPLHAVGAVDVVVTNFDGQSSTLQGGYTYTPAPPPAPATVTPASGTTFGGTIATLTGTDFQAGASVTVGGVPAGVDSVTPTAISFVAPAHAASGAVDLTVTNPDLRTATLAGGFTYVAPPLTNRTVTLSWAANRERGVNQAGGGYRISIVGQPTVGVPWLSGPLAPTSQDVSLASGSYTVSIRAYAALDAQGGSTGTLSAPSQSIAVTIP